MHFRPEERLAILIDGESFYATVVELGFEIDFLRLLALFRQKAKLVHALYYAVLADGEQDGGLRQLLDWLAYNGFTIVTKPPREATGLPQRRMRVGLAVDAVRLADHVDHVILFTGDGDFRALVADVQRRGRRVSVASTLRVAASELRRQADQFIDLRELEHLIGRGRAASAARAPSATAAGATQEAQAAQRPPPEVAHSAARCDAPEDDIPQPDHRE